AIGVGGTFDVMAGVAQRAPVWMQRANLEWLFRLLSEPKRAIRMLALPRFVIKVIATKK
ncbi:MAG: glycosyl transferase, WecB/TagA/CpsF family, partial [Pelosinus sp.]|nr:glycosyl transferase, WecB/TagA/CpsF family [Pelosinus sp.]